MDPNLERNFLGNAKKDSRSFIVSARLDRCAFATVHSFMKQNGGREETKGGIASYALEQLASLITDSGRGRRFNLEQAMDYMEEHGLEVRKEGDRRGVFKDMRLMQDFQVSMDMQKGSELPMFLRIYEEMEDKDRERMREAWKVDAEFGEGREKEMAIEGLRYLEGKKPILPTRPEPGVVRRAREGVVITEQKIDPDDFSIPRDVLEAMKRGEKVSTDIPEKETRPMVEGLIMYMVRGDMSNGMKKETAHPESPLLRELEIMQENGRGVGVSKEQEKELYLLRKGVAEKYGFEWDKRWDRVRPMSG